MSESAPRKYRYARDKLRSHWFSMWVLYATGLPLVAAGAYFYPSPPATGLAIVWAVLALLLWWRERRAEAAHWRDIDGTALWFDDGHLCCEGPIQGRLDLIEVREVRAFLKRGEVDRLAIKHASGHTVLFIGIDDPAVFLADFRRNAPRASYQTTKDWL
ncbi:hypothetical protein [Lysobacter gummosus]|uniref:hypothetical protein n=1 Tax=Lysobacter gummosus TaxID=262324 RepID=UPI00363EFDB7